MSTGWSIKIPHFSQVARSGGVSVTVTLYLAPHLHLCVPVSHSTNSVMPGICVVAGQFSSAELAELAINPQLGPAHCQKLKSRFRFAGFDLIADLELPLLDA